MLRMYRLCMYDPFFCLLVLAFPGHIAWSAVGLQWLGSAEECVRALGGRSRSVAWMTTLEEWMDCLQAGRVVFGCGIRLSVK